MTSLIICGVTCDIQSFLLEPKGIAVHYLKQRLYWVDVSLQYGYQITVLRSAELDGTDVQQVFLYKDVNNMTMPANATDITINLRNNSLYFIDNVREHVQFLLNSSTHLSATVRH
jgi:hypothetical protein